MSGTRTAGGTPEPSRVLVIEDDASLAAGLRFNLSKAGHRVSVARDGLEALEQLRAAEPDLVLLDLMLPGMDGFEVLLQIRRRFPVLPVVILTALGAEADKVRGLDGGANDYVTKPFSIAELLARVRAVLRAPGRDDPREEAPLVLRAGAIEVRPAERKAWVDGIEVDLRGHEFDVLEFMMARPERVITREQLLANVWGRDYEGTHRTVDNFISTLRRKLGEHPSHPRHLRTVRGIGYRFVP